MLCEQVSHHPPISAYHCESIRPQANNKAKWKYYGSVNPYMRVNIMNACVEAFPEGIQTVELPGHDEVYTWQNLKVTAHNVVVGKLWLECTGRLEIVNHKHNIRAVLEFKPYSWFTRSMYRVEGYILDRNDKKIALLNGKWDEFIYATDNVEKSSEFLKKTESLSKTSPPKMKKSASSNSLNEKDITLLWKSEDTNALYAELYNYSYFTLQLNELYNELTKPTLYTVTENNLSKDYSLGPIPITDSRYRTDMRYYENGNLEIASDEKHRLEEKQRKKRHQYEQSNQVWKPLWFEKSNHHVVSSEETFRFNQNYWNRDFSKCPDLY